MNTIQYTKAPAWLYVPTIILYAALLLALLRHYADAWLAAGYTLGYLLALTFVAAFFLLLERSWAAFCEVAIALLLIGLLR